MRIAALVSVFVLLMGGLCGADESGMTLIPFTQKEQNDLPAVLGPNQVISQFAYHLSQAKRLVILRIETTTCEGIQVSELGMYAIFNRSQTPLFAVDFLASAAPIASENSAHGEIVWEWSENQPVLPKGTNTLFAMADNVPPTALRTGDTISTQWTLWFDDGTVSQTETAVFVRGRAPQAELYWRSGSLFVQAVGLPTAWYRLQFSGDLKNWKNYGVDVMGKVDILITTTNVQAQFFRFQFLR